MQRQSSQCVRFEPLETRSLMSSTISGTVFNDADADGHREAGEHGIAGLRVFIDANHDGRFESGETATTANSAGEYSFTGLAAGNYRVAISVPTGYRQTSPALNYYDVSAAGSESTVANDFGFTTTAIVRGTVFADHNKDGVKQSSEHGLANVLVFLDKNGNGKLDAGEKSRYTDASGNYRFRGLTVGNYIVRVSPARGVAVSAGSVGLIRLKLDVAESLSNRNFGLLT